VWPAVAIIVLALILFGGGNPIEPLEEILNTIQRGKRLTRSTYGVDGVVARDPQSLADEAYGVQAPSTDAQAQRRLNAYALARMISSEEGPASNLIKAAIGSVALNWARRRGRSISEILLSAKNDAHDGRFGTQRDIDRESGNFNKSDRYASTALDPYEGDLVIAEGLLDGTIGDPTGGAIQFDAPPAFKSAADAERVAQNRRDEGRTQVYVDGIDAAELRFWA
jgi:hypothetical protein